MKFLSLLILLCFSIKANAQMPGVSWTLQIDGHNTVYLADGIVDKDGNSYYALNYTDDLDIPGLKIEVPYADHVHACLLKVTASGKAEWARPIKSAFDNRITDIAFGQNGDILVTGHGDGKVEFIGQKNSFGKNEGHDGRIYTLPQSFYVARFSAKGELRWVTPFAGSWGLPMSIAENKLNQIFVTYYQNSDLLDENNNIISSFKQSDRKQSKTGIIILDGEGKFQTIRPLGYELSSSSIPRLYVQCDAKNNLLLYGTIYGTIYLTPEDSLTSLNQYISLDGFIAQYNAEGQLQWHQQFSGENTQWIKDIVIAEDNSIYFMGIFDTQCDIYSGIKNTGKSDTPRNSGYNLFHGRLYTDGEMDYVYFFGQKRNAYYVNSAQIALDANNEIHITGTYNDTISFGQQTIYGGYHNSNSFHSVWQKDKNQSLESLGEVNEHFLHFDAFDVGGLQFCGGLSYHGDKNVFFKGKEKIKLKNRDYGGAIVLFGGRIAPKETEWSSPLASQKPNLNDRISAFKPALTCNNSEEEMAEDVWLPILDNTGTAETKPSLPSEIAIISQTPCGEDILTVAAKAYPNPTRGQVTIEVKGLSGNLKVDMYNSSGQLLLSRMNEDIPDIYQMEFDMSTIASGQYIVVLTTTTHQKMLRNEVAR